MKKLLALLLVVAMFAALGANAALAEATTTIRMWTFLDPANTANGRSVALAQMIEEFEAENPGVEIVVEPQDWNTMTGKFLASIASGDAPDIMWCSRDELCGVLNVGALEPLENLFLSEWSEEEIADIDDAFFRFGERDGQHYTLTLSKNAIVLYYRADLLKELGLAVPATWDEILDVAEKMTGEDENGLHRYGLGQAFSTLNADSQLIANYIIDKQGDLFNEDGTAAWATDIGVEALNWTVDTIERGVTPAESVNTSGEDSIIEFQSGKYGMLVLGAVRTPNIKAAASFDADAVQIATIPGGCVLDGWFVGVWSGSENKEMAGKFLEKMYTPEADKLWVELGGQAPVRKSTLDSVTIDETNAYLQVMLDAFDTGWFVDNSMTFSGWKFNLNEAVQQVLANGMDPLAALEKTAQDFNAANNR